MGMLVFFLRSDSDCTNNGVSGNPNVKGFTVVNAEGPFDPSDDYPAASLETGPYGNLRLVPTDLKEAGKWVMFGGNYASTSDSRWADSIAKIRKVDRGVAYDMTAVAVFDRVED